MLTLPPGITAFLASIEPDPFVIADFIITGKTAGGDTAVIFAANGRAGARFFGFHTDGDPIVSIEISTSIPNGWAIAEMRMAGPGRVPDDTLGVLACPIECDPLRVNSEPSAYKSKVTVFEGKEKDCDEVRPRCVRALVYVLWVVKVVAPQPKTLVHVEWGYTDLDGDLVVESNPFAFVSEVVMVVLNVTKPGKVPLLDPHTGRYKDTSRCDVDDHCYGPHLTAGIKPVTDGDGFFRTKVSVFSDEKDIVCGDSFREQVPYAHVVGFWCLLDCDLGGVVESPFKVWTQGSGVAHLSQQKEDSAQWGIVCVTKVYAAGSCVKYLEDICDFAQGPAYDPDHPDCP